MCEGELADIFNLTLNSVDIKSVANMFYGRFFIDDAIADEDEPGAYGFILVLVLIKLLIEELSDVPCSVMFICFCRVSLGCV